MALVEDIDAEIERWSGERRQAEGQREEAEEVERCALGASPAKANGSGPGPGKPKPKPTLQGRILSELGAGPKSLSELMVVLAGERSLAQDAEAAKAALSKLVKEGEIKPITKGSKIVYRREP